MASEPAYLFGINRDLLEFYALYVGILLLKCFLMVIQVGGARFYYKSPRNPEDGKLFNAQNFDNTNVERIRWAHLNDLENIPFFIAISFLYLLTDPSVEPTKWIIRIYVVSRIIYTIVYTIFKSSWRILFFHTGYIINIYLCFSVIIHFAKNI